MGWKIKHITNVAIHLQSLSVYLHNLSTMFV